MAGLLSLLSDELGMGIAMNIVEQKTEGLKQRKIIRCEYLFGGNTIPCREMYNCCDCGGNDCRCRYCFSCNACEICRGEE